MNRRGFLKLIGGVTAAVIAAPVLKLPAPTAPLFVPSANLDFGVPRRILTATEMPAMAPDAIDWADSAAATARMQASVPILMLRDEYSQEWGGRLKAGSTVLVDQATAERWSGIGVSVPVDAPVRSSRESRLSWANTTVSASQTNLYVNGTWKRVPEDNDDINRLIRSVAG